MTHVDRKEIEVTSSTRPESVDAIILVGLGGPYDNRTEEELEGLAKQIAGTAITGFNASFVFEAVLERGSHSIPFALNNCAAAGATRILVVPVFVPVDRANHNWLRFVARRWLRNSACQAEVTIANSINSQSLYATAVVRSIEQAVHDVPPLDPND